MLNNAQYNILIVDDNKTILQMISKCLCEEGYAVDSHYNPCSALQKIKNIRPDLILSDIEMPEMDGFQFYEEIQTDPELRMIPFVFLSALKDRSSILKGKTLGVDDYLIKPFDKEELLSVVKGKLKRGISIKDSQHSSEDRFKKFLISVFNHEIRTPLTLIQGFTALLEKQKFDEKQMKDIIGFIKTGGERIKKFTTDLEDISRLELEKAAVFKRAPVSLYHTLMLVLENLQPLIIKKNIEIKFQNNKLYPTINADEKHIHKVLEKVIDNAIKFNKERGIISIQFFEMNDQLYLEIKDWGKGIKHEDIPFVFDLFFQSDRKTQEQQGLGLGLTIAKEYITHNQGEINIESEEGIGTVVTIKFNEYQK